MQGLEGDTVAAALLAGGHGTLSRSIKYHRPRGLYCGTGTCASCLVTIDGKPSLRACMTACREGMDVQPQNAWPSIDADLFGAADKLMPKDFDPQRTLTRPRFLLPVYHFVVRRMAGLGKTPRSAPPAVVGPVAKETVQLGIVGAGPAGLAAAREAAQSGIRVRLFEAAPWAGGRLGKEETLLQGPLDFAGTSTLAARHALLQDLRQAGCAPEVEASVAGVYPGRLLAVATPHRLIEVRCDALVLAPGAPESLPLFGNNDLPGVMTASAAGQLLLRHRILPGERVVIAGADERACSLAHSLQRAGARVEAVVAADPHAAEVEGLPARAGKLAEAQGSTWVKGVTLADGTHIDCDLVVLAEPRRPAIETFQQAGCNLISGPGVLVPKLDASQRTTSERVFGAGDAAWPGSLEASLASGIVAGLRAAQSLGATVDEARLADAEQFVKRGRAA